MGFRDGSVVFSHEKDISGIDVYGFTRYCSSERHSSVGPWVWQGHEHRLRQRSLHAATDSGTDPKGGKEAESSWTLIDFIMEKSYPGWSYRVKLILLSTCTLPAAASRQRVKPKLPYVQTTFLET